MLCPRSHISLNADLVDCDNQNVQRRDAADLAEKSYGGICSSIEKRPEMRYSDDVEIDGG